MTKITIGIGLLGYGTVGSGVHQLLIRQQQYWLEFGIKLQLIGISVKHPLQHPEISDLLIPAEQLANHPQLDILIEAIAGDCPYPLVLPALERGVKLITANKAFMVRHRDELRELALGRDDLLCGAAVGGGVPVIDFIGDQIAVQHILGFETILNGTTNFILSQIEQGIEFSEAKQLAIERGFAELDLSADIGGLDTAYKTQILLDRLFGIPPKTVEIPIKGASEQWLSDYSNHDHSKSRFRLVAEVDLQTKRFEVRLQPFAPSHPFYFVGEENNAIILHGALTGPLFLQGKGAGKFPTAAAVISDLISLLNSIVHLELLETQQISLGQDTGEITLAEY